MKVILRILLACFIFPISACSNIPQPPLGQEQVVDGEDATIKDISNILSNHLREQYAGKNSSATLTPKQMPASALIS